MGIKVTIEFQTIEEAVKFLIPQVVGVDASCVRGGAVDVPKKSRGRPRKGSTESAAAPAQQSAQADPVNTAGVKPVFPADASAKSASVAPLSAAEATVDDVRAALNKVVGEKGEKAATAIVGKFKTVDGTACRRVSELQPGDYAKIIEACNK
jgi:hypothetical protein